MPVFVLSTLSQVLYKEANELLTFILETSTRFESNLNLHQLTLKSISYLYNYCTVNGRSIPNLQQFVMHCVHKPELFADAVDLLTNILVGTGLSNSVMEYVIKFTLMCNPVIDKIIHDHKEAVRNNVEWKERDNAAKQMVYALCEYVGSIINLSFDGIVSFFTSTNDISASETEAVEYLLKLVLQLLSIEGNIPKYNDIFIGIVNNVHNLLEELADIYENNSECVISFQRNLIDIFFDKLKHPFSYGDKDVDMDEFLDNRDNVGYAFASMNHEMLVDWLKQKLYFYSQSENLNVSDIETVLYFYSQLPEFTNEIVPFEQLHNIFKMAFLSAEDFQETLIDTYVGLLKELFQILKENDLNLLIGFLWDILKNYEPAMGTAACLLSSVYQSEHISISVITSERETQTILLIKDLIDCATWKESNIVLYSIVGRLACVCRNNEELNSLSNAFISSIFEKLTESIRSVVSKKVDINQTQQPIECPDEVIISNQLSLISSFLTPISKFQNNCSQFILEMIDALLQLLSQLAETVIFSVQFYSAMLKLVHSTLLTKIIENPAVVQKFSEILMVLMNTVYRLNVGQSRCACFDLMIATLNIAFQLIVPLHPELATLIYKYFCDLLLDYTFNRFRSNYYMPAFISRCIKFVHSTLIEHGLSTRMRNSDSLCFDHTPNISRPNLSSQKLEWFEKNSAVLKQINWSSLFFIPSFYLGDLTPDVNRASIKLLISAIKCRSQLPDYIVQALVNNLQLVIFNVVKLFSFGVTELGDMVSLITAFRENMCAECVKMLGLVSNEPIVQANQYLQTVTKLVHYLLTGSKLSASTMRMYISNFQENVKLLQPPAQCMQS